MQLRESGYRHESVIPKSSKVTLGHPAINTGSGIGANERFVVDQTIRRELAVSEWRTSQDGLIPF
jgi:hypothetical protein